jgi:CelD/BcsL family acetyltransferase involved in cellulose biosynthesis
MTSVEVHQDVDTLAPEWEALADQVGASPFLRPAWLTAWWGSFGGRGELAILALRRGRRLAAVLPLRRHGGSLRSTANDHTPEFGAVAEDDVAARALAEAVFARSPGRVALRFLDAERELGHWRAAADAAGYRCTQQTLIRSPYLEIATDWAAYERSLPPNVRSEIKRRVRRLRERGELRFEVEDGSRRLDDLLREGFHVEGTAWKREQGTAIESRPETAQFYRDLARSAAEEGRLRLAFLRLDERAVAFAFGLEDHNVHYMLKSGYDPAFGALAPGIILRYHLVARAFAERLSRYEFLGADEPWKLIWTRTTRERAAFRAFPRSPRGSVEWVAFAHGWPLAKRFGLGRLRRFRHASASA